MKEFLLSAIEYTWD